MGRVNIRYGIYRKGGRPKVLNPKKASVAQALYADVSNIADICKTLNILRTTFYRYIDVEKKTA
jgi:hypothetical protein